MVLIWRHFRSARGEDNHFDRLFATTDLHGASLEVSGRHACRLGRCHTDDHLTRNRSRCESRGDVDGITERGEVIDSGAKPGRPNECHAGMDSRPSWNWTPTACGWLVRLARPGRLRLLPLLPDGAAR